MVKALSLIALCYLVYTTTALQVRGIVPITVALCNIWGQTPIPADFKSKAQKFLEASIDQTLYTYYHEQSGGTISFLRSYVMNPIEIGKDVLPNGIAQWNGMGRDQQTIMCREQAVKKNNQPVPSTHKFVAVVSSTPTAGSTGQGVLLAYNGWRGISYWGHEFGHSLGLPDSWSQWPLTVPARIYGDNYDVMSNMGALSRLINTDPEWGYAGPNMAAPNRDRLGWLPVDRVYTLPAGGIGAWRTFTLTTLSKYIGRTTGLLMLRIPARSRPGLDNVHSHCYYTVEARSWEGYDKNMRALGGTEGGAIIHRVVESGQAQPVYLPNGPKQLWQAGDQFDDGQGTIIKINWVDSVSKAVNISVWSPEGDATWGYYGPNRCKNGLVWREADNFDYTCTTPNRRDRVKADNAAYASRRVGEPWEGKCRLPWVPRLAWPRDFVCVELMESYLATNENSVAANNVVSTYGHLDIATPPNTFPLRS